MDRAVVVLLAMCATLALASDQILNLPGAPSSLNFKQYAGYINVNNQTGRNLFYWFTESQNNPATDPVVLWLNGGPGCSSLAGLFEELGPFIPNPDGKTLSLNPYSWNKVANVIFLESPSGVGFSYSDNTSDYNVGDVRTANDSYNFLLEFFQRYPQFANSPFWVTGESYGGHYVPNLSARIILGNSQNKKQQINFKGFMVGNAWTDAAMDNYGAVYDWWTHALISDETFYGLNQTCDFFNIGPLYDSQACEMFQNTANTEMGNIDIYDIYADVCLSSSRQGYHLMNHIANSESKLAPFAAKIASSYQPCVDDYLTNYLNIASVKAAIHASPKIQWTGCANINYSYTDLLTSMLPVYKNLLNDNIQMLVYSGDVDGIVPITGTRIWLKALGLPVTKAWRPWIGSSGQVGGYTVEYQGLTFLSIRNAGHLVPGTQPERALDFFSKFLTGTPF